MNLWCDVHRRSHRFTPSAVERIVYALQAMVAEAEMDEPVYDTEPRQFCPESVLNEAGDGEGFREYVDVRREDRLRAERTRKPQLRGRRP